MENSSPESAHEVFSSVSKNNLLQSPGIDPHRRLMFAFLCFFFIPVLTRVGCDFCRAIADCCCPSTAWCAWLPSACRCPWPSACSPRCLRYSKASAQPSSVLQIQGQLAEKGAAGEKFKLLIHHLKCTSAASRACVHLFAPDVSSNV